MSQSTIMQSKKNAPCHIKGSMNKPLQGGTEVLMKMFSGDDSARLRETGTGKVLR